MMIARHTGYKAGVFSHMVANEQIYDRHMDAAYEMLRRYGILESEYESTPHLELNPEVTDFYNMTISDFNMVNYAPMQPQLKLELGI
jgi:thymidylate synthase